MLETHPFSRLYLNLKKIEMEIVLQKRKDSQPQQIRIFL